MIRSPLKKLEYLHKEERRQGLSFLCTESPAKLVVSPRHGRKLDRLDALNAGERKLKQSLPSLEANKTLLEQAREHSEKFPSDSNALKVFVGNINYRSRDRDIRYHFEYFGKVIRCFLVKDKRSRRFKGTAFITFSCPNEAKAAIEAEPELMCLDGRMLNVQWAQKKRGKGRAPETFEDHQRKLQIVVEKFEESLLTQDICLFHLLDDVLMIKIFLHLPLKNRVLLERVCKRWLTLSRQSWRFQHSLQFEGVFSSSFDSLRTNLSDSVLKSILKRGCHNLKSIDLSASPYLLSHQSLSFIGDICLRLKELNLSRTQTTNMTLKHIAINCRMLEKVTLEECPKLSEKGFWWLFKCSPSLRYVKITENSRLKGKCFFMLNPEMDEIILKGCDQLSSEALKFIGLKCASLKRITLTKCMDITNQGLWRLFEGCKYIEEFTCGGTYSEETMLGFHSIVNLAHLKLLDFHQNHSLDDEFLELISNQCQQLRYFNIEGCHGNITDIGLVSLCRLSNLCHLAVSYLSKITSDGANGLLGSSFFGNLEEFYCRACGAINNNVVSDLLFYNENLKVLDISACEKVDQNVIDLMRSRKIGERQQLIMFVGGTEIDNTCALELKEYLSCQFVSLENKAILALYNHSDMFDLCRLDAFYDDEYDDEDEIDYYLGEDNDIDYFEDDDHLFDEDLEFT